MITIPGPIPTKLHPLFILVAALIGFMNSSEPSHIGIWMGVVFVSVWVHELGHALTALYFGQKPTIFFVATGGLTQRVGKTLPLWQEFVVVLNGPFFGFLLACAAILLESFLMPQPGPWKVALEITILANIFWSIVNLLPVGPLDGAHLMNIMLEGALGARGLKLGYLLSTAAGFLLGALAFAGGLMLLGIILFMLSFESLRSFISARSMVDQDRDGGLQEQFAEAEEARNKGMKEEALAMYQAVRLKAGAGLIYIAATERMAKIYFDRGEFEEAYDLLKPVEPRLGTSAVRLLHRIAYYMRDAEMVMKVGNRCFDYDQSYETAFINALSYAMADQVQESVGWLRQAYEKGMPQMEQNLDKREFDSIRDSEEFHRFKESVEE